MKKKIVGFLGASALVLVFSLFSGYISAQTTRSEIISYFLEIAIGSEHGESIDRIIKWKKDIRIRIRGNPTKEDIQTLNQVTVAKRYSEEVNFVMSPLMKGGRYDGWLPKGLWPKIHELTVGSAQERDHLPGKINLVPEFRELGLAPRAQKPRDTCSLFAITALADFEYARSTSRPHKRLSEEFLIWAANKANGAGGGPGHVLRGCPRPQ